MPDESDRTTLGNEICHLQQEISRSHLLLDQNGICNGLPQVEEKPQIRLYACLIDHS